jgi:glutaredoxin-like YruB-family protein
MPKKVTIYSTPTCGYCQMAKAFFKEHDVKYTEHDVYTDIKAREEMIEKSGQMGVPVIMVDDEIVVGFNQAKLSEMLEIK